MKNQCKKHEFESYEKCVYCRVEELEGEIEKWKAAYHGSCNRIDVLLYELSRVVTQYASPN